MKSILSFALIAVLILSSDPVMAQDNVTWQKVHTLPAGYVIGMEQHPTLGSVALSIGGKISYSIDSGRTWKDLPSTISQSNGMSIDVLDPKILYAATRSGVYASADGKDWDFRGLDEENVRAIDIAQGTNVIMVATLNGIFYSSDRGESWDERNDALPKDVINCIAAAPSSIAFAGTKEGLFKHLDTEFLWQATSLMSEDVTALRINGSTGNGWAGTVNGVYYSSDFGGAWEHRFTTPAEVTFIWHPWPSVLAGTTNGVFYSSDDGQSWKQTSTGIQAPDVTMMMTSKDHHILLATKDGSIYKSNEVVGSTLGVKAKSDAISCQLGPNPANKHVTLTTPNEVRMYEVQILDVTGRAVITSETSGSSITIATSQLPAGSYTARVRSANGIHVSRFVVQH